MTQAPDFLPITPKNDDFLHVRSGVGVVVLTPYGVVLMQRAPGKHGAGTWSLPGGGQERGETLATTARREIREEIGVELTDLRLLPHVTEDRFVAEGQHWNTFYLLGRTTDTPVNNEPHKCTDLFIGWPKDFPHPFFVGIKDLLDRDLIPTAW